MRSRFVPGLLLALLLCLTAALALSECQDYHPFGPWITKRAATCSHEGLQFRYCRRCDHWEQRNTKKLPHTVEEYTIIKEPTCTEEGVRGATCTVCNSYLRTKIEKLGHDWEIVTAKKAPTCTQSGTGAQRCTRCGRTREGTIGKLGHDWGEWTVTREPGEKGQGTREHTCLRCGKTQSEKFYEEGTLYEGMPANEAVKRLQTMLKDLGYYNGGIQTGTFGSQTSRAVEAFQKQHKLTRSGIASPATIESIEEAWQLKIGQRRPAKCAGDRGQRGRGDAAGRRSCRSADSHTHAEADEHACARQRCRQRERHHHRDISRTGKETPRI